MGVVKTTLDIPDAVFRRAKARAAERGETLREFVTEALAARLAAEGIHGRGPAWMEGFGELQRLRKETGRIQKAIDAAFGAVEPEDRA